MKNIIPFLIIFVITFNTSVFGQKNPYKDKINFFYKYNSEPIVNYSFNDGDNNVFDISLIKDKTGLDSLRILMNKEEIPGIENLDLVFFHVSEAGFVKLGEDNHICIFLQSFGGGTGMMTYDLDLINLKNKSQTSLGISFPFDANDLPFLDSGDNFNNEFNKDEKIFLNNLKFEYGYYTAEELYKNSESYNLSNQIWCLYNNKLDDGKLKIIKHDMDKNKIKLPEKEEEECLLDDGNIKYYSAYRSALDAYDVKNNKYYVLYYPRNWDCSVTILKKYKNYLIIGTLCEGYAIINTKTFYLKRHYEQGLYIDRIEIKGDKISLNEELKIPVPDF